VVPSRITDLKIGAEVALELALKSNPDILDQKQQTIEQNRKLPNSFA